MVSAPACVPVANPLQTASLAGDGNQPCLVLVQDWDILEALVDLFPAHGELVEGVRLSCSLIPAKPASPKRYALERISLS